MTIHTGKYMTRRGGRVALPCCLFALLLLVSCAKMGQPDGGWYDELPPRVVATSPAEGSTNVGRRQVVIDFDEYITLENASEKVVVSPPQIQMPNIKAQGKRISVELLDELKPATTYTIDFSDAIADNNEGNPMGKYTYTFSTGAQIDTLEVSGYVLQAEDLEPVKGILVGLYSNLADSAFTTSPMLRVARTDDRGRFTIKGVKAGDYRLYALRDQDNDYRFSQKAEAIAFTPEIFTPTWKPDVRQDTIWRDSLHIAAITPVKYTHFLPDDVALTVFTEEQTDRYFLKSDRTDERFFTLFYTYGDRDLPIVRGLNFNAEEALLVEPSVNQDTITYWLRDTMLINRDTLLMSVQHNVCDTSGVLRQQTDTLQLFAKIPYERRMKLQAEQQKKWEKQQKKRRERGETYETVMPGQMLEPEYDVPSEIDPDQNISILMPTPIASIDTSKIRLYQLEDTVWQETRYLLGEKPGTSRHYEVVAEWEPGMDYALEIDSAAFTDIYGRTQKAEQLDFAVRRTEEYATLSITLQGMEGRHCVVQLLNKQDKPVRQAATSDGTAHIFYIKPGTYYLRMFVDDNDNGRWDTGLYAAGRQAEAVYYYPKSLECRAKWDISETWNPKAMPLFLQKLAEITRQKGDKQKAVRHRNAERAANMGIEIPASILNKENR